MDDEEVVYQTRIHWIVFVPWVFLTIVVLCVLFFVRDNPTYVLLIRALAAVLLIKAVAANLIFWTAEYGVTTKRVLGKTGLVRIQSLDILLLKVEAVRLNQGLMGRIFNYGNLIVTGTGGTQEVLYDLPDPMEVRKIIQEHANRANNESTVQQ